MKITNDFEPYCDNCTLCEPITTMSIWHGHAGDRQGIKIEITCEHIEQCRRLKEEMQKRMEDPVQTMHEATKRIFENEKEPECHNCKNILCGSFAEPCASCYKIGINWEPKE